MRLFSLATVILIASPLVIASGSAMAATAHNSSTGGYGTSSNAGDATLSSPHVKHAAKHRGMREAR